MKRRLNYLVTNFSTLVFNITYTLSCVLIYLGLLWVLPEMLFVLLVFISLGYLLLSLFTWGFLQTLFTIPQKMAGAYDQVKNAIASKEISTLDAYLNTMVSFLIGFFDFSFFDIPYAAIKIDTADLQCSSSQLNEVLNWEKIGESAAASAEIQKHGKVAVGKEKLHAYTVPVWFVNDKLGFFTVFSKQRLGPVRLKILADLEDNYIDDQVFCLNRDGSGANTSYTINKMK